MPVKSLNYLPHWTPREVTSFGGRDPLGLSRLSEHLTEYLLDGIITMTSRARYYAIYPWIAWHVVETESPTTREAFIQAFQRRESAIAYATVLDNKELRPIGVEVIQSKLIDAEAPDLPAQIQVLPSQPLGGYGQAYGGSLEALGLVTHDEQGLLKVREGAGLELAREVQNTLAQTPYIQEEHFLKERVSREVLERSASRLGLAAVRADLGARERERLIRVLFALGPTKLGQDVRRRNTLLRILHTLDLYEQAGAPVTEQHLDWLLLYAPVYYGALEVEGRPVPVAWPAALESNADAWTLFCAHAYLTRALELLLVAFLETIGRNPEGLTLDEALDGMLGGSFQDCLHSILTVRADEPASLLAAAEAEIPSRWGDSWSEVSLADLEFDSASARTAGALSLLARLVVRWRRPTASAALALVQEKTGEEPWTGTVLRALDTWREPSCTYRGALRALLQKWVLSWHDIVMYDKGSLESCWFHRMRIPREADHALYRKPIAVSTAKPITRCTRSRSWIPRQADHGMTPASRRRETLVRSGR